MSSATREEEQSTTPDPDWGLGAVADPVSFGAALLELGKRLAQDPVTVAGVGSRFVAGLAETGVAVTARALGASTTGPAEVDPADPRFRDPTWDSNPLFYGWRQAYLLWGNAMRELSAPGPEDGELAAKAEFVTGQIVDALAPTNFLPGNPPALKRAFETGGASVARGFLQFLDDLANNGGWPRQVDKSGFTLGENLAATPGKVVFRNDLIELIQYAPQTETVFATPIVLSPPWINKYYVMDLAPGKSFAEWAITHGHTVFAISYRNPDESMRDLGMEDYMRNGLLAALETIGEITGADEINIASLCLGGTLTAVLLAYLARPDVKGPKVRSATLLNTLVDFSDPGPLGHFVDETTVGRLEARMAKKGFLPADQMAGTFNLLRANDLIWRYVSAGWLMGESPPASPGTTTRRGCPLGCIRSTCTPCISRTGLRTELSRSVARRSISAPPTPRCTSSRRGKTTSRPGVAAIARHLSSAGRSASCSPRRVTSPGSSTRPARSAATSRTTSSLPIPTHGSREPRRCRGRGGKTGRRGSASAPESSESLPRSGATPIRRS
jgi:polyhydroxyalkanoate synthase